MSAVPPNDLQACPMARNEGLETQSVDSDVLVYDRIEQRAHCLNRPAALLWRYCDGKTPFTDLTVRFAADLAGAADDEVVLFGLRQLGERGLLEHPVVLPQGTATSRRQLLLRRGVDAARFVPLVTSLVAPAANSQSLILRGGAVRWRGRAILLPSTDRGSGTTRLLDALVRAGAELIVDGEIRFDERDRVRIPFGAPTAASATEPVDVALIVATTYQDGAPWQPAVLRGSRATLPILNRAAATGGALRQLLQLAARLAPRVTTLSGPRPDADRVAPEILACIDAGIDRPAPEAGRTHDAREGARAASVLKVADRVDSDSSEMERQLLLQQPSIVMLRWHGRFGNRMHQYAYGVTYARLNGYRLWLPSHWEGTHLFERPHHRVLPPGRLRTRLGRPPHLDSTERRLRALRAVVPDAVQVRPEDPRENYSRPGPTVAFEDMCTYEPSIFTRMSRAHLRSVFELSAAVKRLDVYKRLEDRQGTYDIAHLRRDDISDPKYNQTHVQGYSVVSKRSYERAFARFGFDPAAVEWVSDDYTGSWHRDRPPTPRGGWVYPEGSEVLPGFIFDWLEDFLRLYFARTIFRANSSFSWWAAFLSPCARVFSPVIDKRHIYGIDGLEEIDVEFVEGNHPHWMYGNADIVIPDDPPAA